MELVEDLLEFFLRDPDSRVRDRHDDPGLWGRFPTSFDRDGPSLRRELDGIGEDICHDLDEPVTVAEKTRQ
jgi:hypothetical protein